VVYTHLQDDFAAHFEGESHSAQPLKRVIGRAVAKTVWQLKKLVSFPSQRSPSQGKNTILETTVRKELSIKSHRFTAKGFVLLG